MMVSQSTSNWRFLAVSSTRRTYESFPVRRHPTVNSLPSELLSGIFLFAIQPCKPLCESIQSPRVISQVCSRWRQVALTTGGLWTNIIITFPISQAQFKRAVLWLARSRTYPLDLLLDFRDPAWDWEETSHKFRWQDMETIIRLLLVHVKRWRRFELLTDTWAPIFTFLWYTNRVKSAPLLQSISLSRCNAYFATNAHTFQPASLKYPIALFGGLPLDKLSQVSLVGVHVNWSKSSLQNLTELDLKYHAIDVMPSLDQFINILASCPHLQHLSIIGWGPQFDTPLHITQDGDEVNLTKLQRSIRLPRLTRFSFGFVDTDYAVELLSLFYLPSLEELILENVPATLDPLESQDATPVLEWLTQNHKLKCSSESLHTSACCGSTSFPLTNVRSLQVHDIHLNEVVFSRFLHEFDGLKCLRLCNTKRDMLYALGPTSHSESGPPVIPCPMLRELFCWDVNPGHLTEVLLRRVEVGHASSLCKLTLTSQDGSFRLTRAQRGKLVNIGITIFDVSESM